MKLGDKSIFLEKSSDALGNIYDMLSNLPVLKLKDLPGKQTVFVIVDMINGFAREGALSSPRVKEIIPGITELSKLCDEFGIPKLAFADCHTEASPEFDAYPVHCIAGTDEGEIVDEIKEIGGYKLIFKNSTNGFLEEGFRKWLNENQQVNTFIVAGDCTDICVQQFATTIKTWFNMKNRKVRIIVPIHAVETYDFGLHNGDLANVMALYNMLINGIEIVKTAES